VPVTTTYKTLVSRDLKNVLRNPLLIKTRFLQSVFISIFSGGLFCKFSGDDMDMLNWRKLTGFLFFYSISMMMIALSPVALIFPTERNVYLK